MWQNKDNSLYKSFKFKDFSEAFSFMSEVAKLADRHNHHPTIKNSWNKVELWLSTHDLGRVTEKDEELAKFIDDINKKPSKSVDAHPKIKEAKMYADGGSRGNPGPSAGGFVIFDMNDRVLIESGKYLGLTTNNQAEYHSLKGGVEAAAKMGVEVLHVYMDSLLVVNQMIGIYKIRNRDLWPIHEAIKKLLPKFQKVSFSHVPRELNKHADAIVNETLDSEKLH